jgi:hypothetical protein
MSAGLWGRMTEERFPDFVILGAMKSATSTLYEWLDQQPDVAVARPKELDFFSDGKEWAKGVPAYMARFPVAPRGVLLGEASVSYSDPALADDAAERMRSVIPEVKLVFVIRHPIERLRSHYRHEVQRGRERRSFEQALAQEGSPYVTRSCYFRGLEPYTRRFEPEKILVIRFDDLVRAPWPGWSALMGFLGLPERPAPGSAHNLTQDNAQWTPALRWLLERGVIRFRTVARLPSPVRGVGKRLLMRNGARYRERLGRSTLPVDAALEDLIWHDVERLEAWLDRGPLWDRK